MKTSQETRAIDWSDPTADKLTLLAQAAVDGFRSLCLPADGGSAVEVGGATCWYSSSYVPVFNGAALFTQELINGATLRAINRYFSSRQRPYCVATMDALVPGAQALLDNLGYSEYDALPAMWLDSPPKEREGSPQGLRIRRVETPADLSIYRALLGEVFHLPASETNLVLGDRALEVPHVRHYLAWVDSVPVATTSLVLIKPVAGVWNVGTLLSYRRRGISSTTVCHALAEARSLGYRSSMLLSSSEGLRMYDRMGYITLSTLRIFVPGIRG